MAKPLSKKVEKQIRKGTKAVEKTFDRLTPDDTPSTGVIVGAAVAGVAGVAGIVAGIRHLRNGTDTHATLHVRASGDQWVVVAEGRDDPLDVFSTKEDAVDAARDAAGQAAPSELVIHRLDGSEMQRHSYAAD